MAEMVQTNGRTIVNYMARDYKSFLRSMRDLVPDKLPEWTEFESEADFGNVLLELFAHMGDILSYYQDRVANESFLGTAQSRRSILHHLRLIGYRLAPAAPAAALLELSFPGEATGTVTVRRGDAFATKSQKDKPAVRFEYNSEERTIDLDALKKGSDGRKTYKNLPVEEGRRVQEELLGESDGSPHQSFTLARSPLILRSQGPSEGMPQDVLLVSQLGKDGGKEWTLQESLAFSRAGRRDYVLEIDEDDRATVRFGDDTLGAIPEGGAEIRATYRVGGGLAGNVAAGTIVTLVDAPELAGKGAKVKNPAAATGGAQRESIEHAVLHAPNVFRSLRRAVTAKDYKELALGFPGVGKVRAEAVNWNKVTLYVAPEGGGQVSDVLEANLLAYFEDKRPVSTVIEIADVSYVPIYVTCRVKVKGYYSQQAVVEEVREKAGGLLAFDKVDFANTIYLSKFYEAIEAIDGVDSVYVSEFAYRRGEQVLQATEGRISLQPEELPSIPAGDAYSGGIRVELETEEKGGI